VLALTLLASEAHAQPPGTPLATGLGIEPVLLTANDATVKGKCPAYSTEFSKPEFPNFLSGPEGGVVSDTYSVWDPILEEYVDVVVTLTYYSDTEQDRDMRNSFDFAIEGGAMAKLVIKRSDGLLYDYIPETSADTGLNKQRGGADEISHLEFCLTPNLPPNTSYARFCLEDADGIPDGEIGIGGCNPSTSQIVELPNKLKDSLLRETVTQALAPVWPGVDKAEGLCEGDFSVFDPRLVYDLSGSNPGGNPYGSATGEIEGVSSVLDLTTLFDLREFFAPNAVPPLRLRADTVGSPCLALIVGNNSFEFADLGLGPQDAQYAISTVTQLPSEVPGMYIDERVGLLEDQGDLQWVEQASYQPTLIDLLIEGAASPFTFNVFNPPRLRVFEGSFYPLNTREVCLSLVGTSLVGVEYYEAVLQCKIDLAVEYFFTLEQALNNAEANGTLISPSLNRLLRDHSRALSMIKTLKWDRAVDRLGDLRTQIVNGEWFVTTANDPGNLIMRIDNLIWRSQQLKIAHEALLAMQ
jgi:hypothetical protein